MKEFLQMLLDRAAIIPGIEASLLFNDQVSKWRGSKADDIEPENRPLILVEVERVDYAQLPNSYQNADLDIKIHIVYDSPLQGEEMDIYDIKDKVHQYMNRFRNAPYMIEMVRTSETLDRGHDMIYDYVITYHTQFTDYTPPIEAPVYKDLTLNLEMDLDIDNDILRTGDNKDYRF